MLSTKELSQLKKVYDSLPEFLKYVKMNTPTTSTPDLVPIANNWVYGLDPMTRSDILNRPSKYATYEEHIVNEWLQAVVSPWQEGIGIEAFPKLAKERMGYLPDYFSPQYIAEVYLKEQEVKESVDLVPDNKMVYVPKVKSDMDTITIYGAGKFRESALVLRKDSAMLLFSELWKVLFPDIPQQSTHPLESISEKVLSTETVDQELQYFRDKERTDAVYTLRVKQDLSDAKELIQSLLDALKISSPLSSPISKFQNGEEYNKDFRQMQSAITKAQEYLGTKNDNK